MPKENFYREIVQVQNLSLCSWEPCHLLVMGKIKQSHSVSLQPIPTNSSRYAEAF